MKPLPLSNDKPIPIAAVPSYADGSISPRGRNLEMPSLAQLSAASSAPKSPRKAANDTPERAVKRLVHNMSKLNSLVDDLVLSLLSHNFTISDWWGCVRRQTLRSRNSSVPSSMNL